MNIVKLIMASAALSMFAVGCSLDEKVQIDNTSESLRVVERQGRTYPVEAFVPGVLSVKVSTQMADQIRPEYDVNGKLVSTGVASLDEFVAELGVTEMVRIFPDAGKFESRHRKAGLHQWYDMFFDANTPLTKASRSVEAVDGIECIEYNPKIVLFENNGGLNVSPLTAVTPKDAPSESVYPFDDPELSKQWHYYNDGRTSTGQGIVGADINVFPVWKKGIVGKPEVIVAVLDEGVDYLHEDLADNMWTSILADGTDEDGRQIYGANFGNKFGISYDIDAGNHGTHVAGTVAAVNNNGIGVSGVAGGDYKNGKSGVKLMSLQLFDAAGNSHQRAHEAMVWAADHGAVIAQNSWGYRPDMINYMPEDDKVAIDYFTENAGIDENGNQVGAMRGGLVIFASGNESSPMAYPASYDKCLTVGSMMSNYVMAPYFNYGEWVDVTAPGGSWAQSNGMPVEDWIYSTLPGNRYGWNSGTSMACPHVSGVAALVVSENAGNITNEELRSILTMGVKNIAKYNPGKEGTYGSGLIDAVKCIDGIQEGGSVAKIEDFEATAKADMIYFSFTMPTSTSKPSILYVLYSPENITEENYRDARMHAFDVSALEAGATVSSNFSTGIFGQRIYVSAMLVDDNAQRSALADVIQVETVENNAPVIESLDGDTINVKLTQTLTARFVINDPDGHNVTPSLEPALNYISYTYTGKENGNDTLVMKFMGNYVGSEMSGVLTLKVTDDYGMSTEKEINYSFTKNRTPVLVATPPDINLTVGDAPFAFEFTDEYIYEMDNDPLSIRIVTDTTGNGIVNLSTDGPVIYIEPVGVGSIKLELMVRDPMGTSATAFLNVNVKPTDKPLNLYPNPVIDILNIASRVGNIKDAQVIVYSESGSAIFEQQMDIIKGAPAQVDMTGYPAGTYSVSVVTDGQTHNSNFVKL